MELDEHSSQKDGAKAKTFSEHMTVLGATPPLPRPRRWLAPVTIAAAVVVVGGAASIYGHQALSDAFFKQKSAAANVIQPLSQSTENRAKTSSPAEELVPNDSSSSAEAVETTPVVTASPVTPAPTAPKYTPTATQIIEPKVDEPAPGTALLHASLKASQASWIAVCYDGKERFQRLLAAGTTQEITFSDAALVRLGNGPAVDVTFEGKMVERNGPPSVVRTVELSAAGGRFVNYNGPSKACGTEIASAAAGSAAVAH
jgi:cytoskeletal protein RodZ